MEAAFNEEAWTKRYRSIRYMKRTSFALTQCDYNELFTGKVKYLKTGYEIEDGGSKKIAFKRFMWKLFHRHGECPYKQPHRFQHFLFDRCVYGEYDLPAWNDDDMRALIEDNNIQPGDMISFYYISSKNGGHGAGSNLRGRQYVVLEKGWKMIGRIMGP